MQTYKVKNQNEFSKKRQLVYSTENDEELDLTKDRIMFFQNLYQTLLSINPTTDHQLFCTNLNILTNQAEISNKNFENWSEIHNYPFFQSIVTLLNIDNLEVVLAILNFLNKLLQFDGPIKSALFETQLIEICARLFMQHPGLLTPILLEVFINIATKESYSSSNYLSTNSIIRIFKQISIDQINGIVVECLLSNSNIDKKKLNVLFSLFLHHISQIQLDNTIQEFILNYISEQYANQNEDVFYNNIWTLSQMTKYKSQFPIQLFIQNELHKFVVDMINKEEDEYIYPALKVIFHISEIPINPDDHFPKIQSNLDNRIFCIANNQTYNGQKIYKKSTRIAAIRALNSMMITNQYFQRVEPSSIQFLLNTICGGNAYDVQKWLSFMNFFDSSSYDLKNALIEFLTQFIISGSLVQGKLFIQFLINNGIIRIFMDVIDANDEKSQMLSIIAIMILIDESEKYGCSGLFEMNAINQIDINIIIQIIDNSDDKDLRYKAKILHSKLRHLPNKLFLQNTESEEDF